MKDVYNNYKRQNYGKHKNEIKRTTITIFLILIGVVVFYTMYNNSDAVSRVDIGSAAVHFIDVGQGDCIFIESVDGCVLIDAGDESSEDVVLDYLSDIGINKIDYVIATHPHSDHIGGLDAVIDNFAIGTFYAPKVTHTTVAFENMVNSLKAKNMKIETAKAGDTFEVGEMKFEILSPMKESYDDLNDYSVVMKMTFGNKSFLFTGDAEKLVEEEMLDTYTAAKIDADVLKVPHHGSNTSSTQLFVRTVRPEIAIIMSEKGNSYGHPHDEVLKKYEEVKSEILRTDILGTMVIVTDGNTLDAVY